jgi:hypothetical protein
MDFLISLSMFVPIMVAQGGVVLATARFARQRAGGNRWWSKVAAMIASYLGWTAFTIGGYILLGGGGGLMEGMGLILFLCFTAMIASVIYLAIWLLLGRPANIAA